MVYGAGAAQKYLKLISIHKHFKMESTGYFANTVEAACVSHIPVGGCALWNMKITLKGRLLSLGDGLEESHCGVVDAISRLASPRFPKWALCTRGVEPVTQTPHYPQPTTEESKHWDVCSPPSLTTDLGSVSFLFPSGLSFMLILT